MTYGQSKVLSFNIKVVIFIVRVSILMSTDSRDMYNCCSCGKECGDDGCGCPYCFDCNACDHCLSDDSE